MDTVINTSGLTRKFGEIEAVKDLDLTVPRGSVYGYLGRNGAGKSTTIKLLLGLIRPDAGSMNVLGHDPLEDPVPMRRKIGYVAEGQKMYGWMTVREILKFTAGFYPEWDAEMADRYRDRFELVPDAKVKTLSKGQNARLALLLALAPVPDLLILDDPTMGLDPISRQEFLGDIVRAIQEEGRTVFFSTHILQELEQVADWVGIIDRGRLLLSSPVDELKAGTCRYELTFEGPAPTDIGFDGLLRARPNGRDLVVTAMGAPDELSGMLRQAYNPLTLEHRSLSLDEIFTEVVLGGRGGGVESLLMEAEEGASGPALEEDTESVAGSGDRE